MAAGSQNRGSTFASLIGSCDWIGEFAYLLMGTIGHLARGRILLAQTINQMAAIGVSSVPVTMLTVAFSGMVLALQGANTMKELGVERLVGGIVAVSMAREAAPVLTAVVVAARVGSAIAAEIGTMVVTEQVDALRSLGVSPVRYLAVPRFVAAVLMLPVLTMFANLAGVGGAYFVSVYGAQVGSSIFLRSAEEMLVLDDLLLGLAKTFVFGAIIALVACNQGLRTEGGAAGVGRSTTGSVVISIALVYAANYLLSAMMFGEAPIQY